MREADTEKWSVKSFLFTFREKEVQITQSFFSYWQAVYILRKSRLSRGHRNPSVQIERVLRLNSSVLFQNLSRLLFEFTSLCFHQICVFQGLLLLTEFWGKKINVGVDFEENCAELLLTFPIWKLCSMSSCLTPVSFQLCVVLDLCSWLLSIIFMDYVCMRRQCLL